MSRRLNKLSSFAGLASFFLIVASLYWGRPVLMPLAMALLLAFILNPLVTVLRRWHLGHALAVTVVVTLAFTLLGGVLFAIGRQLDKFAVELPQYEDNIRLKIRDMRRLFESDAFDRTRITLQRLRGELGKREVPAAAAGQTNTVASATEPATTPSNVPAPAPKAATEVVPGVVTQLLGPVSYMLATAALVIVLVIFMLLRRDELRNRLILLGGLERREVTTRILSETGQRITRYLLTYTLLNTIYGLAVAVGLYFIGLPYALLWGFFAGAVRFIPYVGPWLGALLPLTFALAVFPGWLHPLLIIGYYIVIELTTNMLLEPIFYGRSAGVSEVALIIVLAFWAWVWGPIGLLLGTPLTVCLVVLAKHIPGMELIHVLIGDGPVEEISLLYYERLCTRKDRNSRMIVRDYVKRNPRVRVFDDLLLPALVFAKRDQQTDKMSGDVAECIHRNVRRAIVLAERCKEERTDEPEKNPKMTVHGLVVGIQSGDAAGDELAFLMLKRLLQDSGLDLEVVTSISEYTREVVQKKPVAVCLGGLPPHLEKFGDEIATSLRDSGYDGPIVVARWGVGQELDRRLGSALGAEYEGIGLSETRENILSEITGKHAETKAAA